MSTLTAFPASAVSWLDQRGRPAWIFSMVMGFIIFWPVGLGLLAFMAFTGRFGSGCARRAGHWQMPRQPMMRGSSGNEAFDAYKADVIDRLEREQGAFEAFLARLRASKDKAQFDDYMAERARAAESERTTDPSQPDTPKGTGAY